MKQISATLVDFTSSMQYIFPYFLETVPIPIKMTDYYSGENMNEFSHVYQHTPKSIIVFYLSDHHDTIEQEKKLINDFIMINPGQTGFIISGGDTQIIRNLITATSYLLLHKDEPTAILAYYLMQGCCNRGAHSPLIYKIKAMPVQPPLKTRVQYLNGKEKAVMHNFLMGMPLEAIAREQQSPKKTIASRKYSAMRKLGVDNKMQLLQLDPDWLIMSEPTEGVDTAYFSNYSMARHRFSPEFKRETAKLVIENKYTINQAASLKKVSISSVRKWVMELNNRQPSQE